MKAISVLLLICASCTGGAIDPGYSLVARIHAVDGGAIPGAELRLFCADSISVEVADSGGTISQLGIGIGRELTCKIVIKAAGLSKLGIDDRRELSNTDGPGSVPLQALLCEHRDRRDAVPREVTEPSEPT